MLECGAIKDTTAKGSKVQTVSFRLFRMGGFEPHEKMGENYPMWFECVPYV